MDHEQYNLVLRHLREIDRKVDRLLELTAQETKETLCSFCGSDHYLFVSKQCSGIYICAACVRKYFTKFNADKAYRKREEMLQKVKS